MYSFGAISEKAYSLYHIGVDFALSIGETQDPKDLIDSHTVELDADSAKFMTLDRASTIIINGEAFNFDKEFPIEFGNRKKGHCVPSSIYDDVFAAWKISSQKYNGLFPKVQVELDDGT